MRCLLVVFLLRMSINFTSQTQFYSNTFDWHLNVVCNFRLRLWVSLYKYLLHHLNTTNKLTFGIHG